MPPSVIATTSGSSSEGIVASAAPASAIGGTRPANQASAENEAGCIRRDEVGCGAQRRPADESDRRHVRDAHQEQAASSVSAGTSRARPMATIASGDQRDDGSCERGHPDAANRRPGEGQGHERLRRSRRLCRAAGDVPAVAANAGAPVSATPAGTTSPSASARIMAIVASTCRRSHTSTAANSTSPMAGGSDVDLDLVPPGPASEPEPQCQRRGGERRPREEPARCVRERRPRGSRLEHAARLGARRRRPSQRVTDAPAKPSATTASIAQRKSVAGDSDDRPRRCPSPARRRRRSDERASR